MSLTLVVFAIVALAAVILFVRSHREVPSSAGAISHAGDEPPQGRPAR